MGVRTGESCVGRLDVDLACLLGCPVERFRSGGGEVIFEIKWWFSGLGSEAFGQTEWVMGYGLW